MGMVRCAIWVAVLAAAATGAMAQTTISRILEGVERRYNSTRTLEADFQQLYRFGPRKRAESGTLYLEKPGKMRWQYESPAGKVFVSDGKYVYLYSPATNVAERTPFKATDDLRAPLAFLLGKLDFQKDFGRFTSKPMGENTWIAAEPKSNKSPYSLVSFLVAPDFRILEVEVTGVDQAVNHFRFGQEQRNQQLAASLFEFRPPRGARIVEAEQ